MGRFKKQLKKNKISLYWDMDHLNTWTRDRDIFQVKVYARRAMVYNSYLVLLMQRKLSF